jgi:hypothetical protein
LIARLNGDIGGDPARANSGNAANVLVEGGDCGREHPRPEAVDDGREVILDDLMPKPQHNTATRAVAAITASIEPPLSGGSPDRAAGT